MSCARATMGIPRNVCKSSESESPVIMHVAWPATASSRNLSSLRSRLARVLNEPLEKNRAFVSSQVAIERGALQRPRKLREGAIGPEQDPGSPGFVTA
jgi:hypothetical protein